VYKRQAEYGARAIVRVHAGDGMEAEAQNLEAEVVSLTGGDLGEVLEFDEGPDEAIGGASVEAGAGGDLAQGEFGVIAVEGFEDTKSLGERKHLALGIDANAGGAIDLAHRPMIA
jgi:hypothetical protein